MAIFVTIGFFHFLLDGGLAYAKPGSGGSQSGDTVVSPPCCHSGSLAGRRATEASPACIPCPGSSSGAGSSIATAFSVYPACSDGTRVKLTISGGKLGPYPPQWPIPTVSGLFYTSAFLPCTPQRHGKLRVKGTDDCWWRSQKAGSDPKKHAALYECDRTTNTHGILEGETAAEARQRSQRASGETAKEARLRTDQAAGFATSSEARKAREVAYANTHGHWRESGLKTMVSKDGVRTPSSRSFNGHFSNDEQGCALVRHNKLKTSSQPSTFADSASPEGDTDDRFFTVKRCAYQ